MKRWAVVTVGLYLLVALLLTVPLALGWYAGELSGPRGLIAPTLRIYRQWGYWVWIGVAVLSQALLLVVPVASAERRPRGRRQLLVPVLTAAFLLALVCVAGLVALDTGIWGDNAGLLAWAGKHDEWGGAILLAFVLIAWTVWAFVFRRYAARVDPESLTHRIVSWMLKGSILELLVAVPSHIATRRRDDCCAPILSFWGIVTGITVMLLAFGPGVYFLFVERVRRKTRGMSGR